MLLICTVLWTWRYISMNRYYDSFGNISEIIYQIGDIVPLDNNRLGGFYQADGYSFRVNSFDIVNYEEYTLETGTQFNNLYKNPEKLGILNITLFNSDSNADGIMLTELKLHGIDNYVGMNWDLLVALNSILEGNVGIKLPHNTEVDLILPYNIPQEYFSSRTWKNLDDYAWFFEIASWPINLEVSLEN